MAVFFISLWLLLWVSTEKGVVSAQTDQALRRISMQEEINRVAELERQSRSQMQQDVQLDEQQRMQLAAARQLISLKAFSWNRLIGDIETHTPKDARILSIKGDESSKGGDTTVEIKAVGKTAAQMTEMMETLEKSGGLFVILQSGQDAIDDTGEVPFTLELVYSPSRGNAQ